MTKSHQVKLLVVHSSRHQPCDEIMDLLPILKEILNIWMMDPNRYLDDGSES